MSGPQLSIASAAVNHSLTLSARAFHRFHGQCLAQIEVVKGVRAVKFNEGCIKAHQLADSLRLVRIRSERMLTARSWRKPTSHSESS